MIEAGHIERIVNDVTTARFGASSVEAISSEPRLDSGGHDALRVTITAVVELYGKRHEADCDPLLRVKSADAWAALKAARAAIHRFECASVEDRRLFLTLLLFPPRR